MGVFAQVGHGISDVLGWFGLHKGGKAKSQQAKKQVAKIKRDIAKLRKIQKKPKARK